MNGFLAILVSISVVALVIGLATPEVFRRVFKSKTGRTSVGLSVGSLVVVFLVLFIVTAPKNNNQVDENTSPKISNSTKPTTNITQKPTATDQSEVIATPPPQNTNSSSNSSSTSTSEAVDGPTTSVSGPSSVSGDGQVSGVIASPPITQTIDIGQYVQAPLTPVKTTCKSLSINLHC